MSVNECLHLCLNVVFTTQRILKFYIFVFQALELPQVLFFYFETILGTVLAVLRADRRYIQKLWMGKKKERIL